MSEREDKSVLLRAASILARNGKDDLADKLIAEARKLGVWSR